MTKTVSNTLRGTKIEEDRRAYAFCDRFYDLSANSDALPGARVSSLASVPCLPANGWRPPQYRTRPRLPQRLKDSKAPQPPRVPQPPPTQRVPEEGQQTKRILWIVPNFRAVSAGAKLPPQSVKEKFKTGALDSFDYSVVHLRRHPGGYQSGHGCLSGISPRRRRIRPILLAHLRRPDG